MSRKLSKEEQSGIKALQDYLMSNWDSSYYFKITTDDVVIDRKVITEIPMADYVED